MGRCSRRGVVDELVERAFLEMLVETPAPDLLEYAFELLSGDRVADEALAAGEAAEVPFPVLELRRNAMPPQRQVPRQIGLERALGAVECAQVSAYLVFRCGFRHPPQRMELVGDDFAKAQLLRHVDLRRQQACRLDLLVEQRCEARAETAHVGRLDV